MDEIQIGMFIASCRENEQLTQQELADHLGVSSKLVSQWETGKRMPHTSQIPRLCEALHMSVNELLSGKKLKEEEERQEIEQTVMLLLNTNRKLNKFRMFHKVLCVFGILMMLGCGYIGYYAYWYFHPMIDIQVSQYGKGENLKIEMPAVSFASPVYETAPSVLLNIFQLIKQCEQTNQIVFDHYKYASIKIDIEEKDGQTILQYAGPATTLDDELIEFEKQIILDFALGANINDPL